MPLNLIPPTLEWASWISMARYGFSSLMINEFGGRSIPCGDEEIADTTAKCPLQGDDVIQSYGIEGAFTSHINIAVLAIIQVVLRVSTYILLRRSK